MAEYALLETRVVDQRRLPSGNPTTFTGIPFGKESAFSYQEAKLLLRLTTAELRKRRDLSEQLGVAADLPGRASIKDDAEAVWDVLRFEKSRDLKEFSDWPHLTLGICADRLEAMLTLPHKSRGRLPALDRDMFERMVRDVLSGVQPLLVRCPGSQPRMRAQQRHWPIRNCAAVLDALIDFDLRALDGGEGVKAQPQWLDAALAALANRKANIEVQIGVYFPYQSCNAVRTVEILDRVAEAWLGCGPLIENLSTVRSHERAEEKRRPLGRTPSS